MKSYLIIWFNSEGSKPSDVTERLMSMGFRPVKGNYDYVYDWGKKAGVKEAARMADRVQQTLGNSNIAFKLETVE